MSLLICLRLWHFLLSEPQQANILNQWRTQKIFMGLVSWGSYGGHLYLVCAVCDVTIWRHFHVSKPRFWRSLL